MVEPIMVGTDGTEGAQRAVEFTADLAAKLDAAAIAVHVVSRTWLIELAALQIDTSPLIRTATERLRTEWSEPFRHLSVPYTTEVLHGDPATELLTAATARHAGLLVIGATHHHGIRGALLGGTAHRVVNRCSIPLVVVPAPASADPPRLPPIPG